MYGNANVELYLGFEKSQN